MNDSCQDSSGDLGSEERVRAGGGHSLALESRICGCAQEKLPRGEVEGKDGHWRQAACVGTWRWRAENRRSLSGS